MADTVTTKVLQNTESEYVIRLTCISDGTGETNVVKVDKSTLTNVNGDVPLQINLITVRWAVQGFQYIKLSWDANTDDTAMILSGNGYDTFEAAGGLRDPRSAGAVGDILLSSVGPTAGGVYDITLVCQIQ